MLKYELLTIFPGTLAENEVAGAETGVKDILEKNGATSVTVQDLGKSRLAYPMKQIRYGYFRMYYFDAEPSAASLLQHKVLLSNTALRAILRRYDPKAEAKKIAQIMSDIAISTAVQEARKEAPAASDTYEAIQTITRDRRAEEPGRETEKTTTAVPLGDIDKKLDELLEKDLTNV